MRARHKLKLHGALLSACFMAVAALAAFAFASTSAADPAAEPAKAPCPLFAAAAPEKPLRRTATVKEVRDNQNLLLDNGQTIRLIGALPVNIYKNAASPTAKGLNRLALEAIAFLRGKLQGRTISYVQTGRKRDRYDRLLAHVFSDKGQWIQGLLLQKGYARAYSFEDNRACFSAMATRERQARDKRLGLWRFRAMQPVSADRVKLLARRRYSYQLVEGRVKKAAALRKWTFLNFSDNWKRDFTIAIKRKYRKKMQAEGFDAQQLQGKRLRVRGWIENWNGPLIKITHKQQIELLKE